MEKKKGQRPDKPGKSRQARRLSPERENKIARKVENIVAKLCKDEGIELVHVEFVSESHHYFLRVYIDKPDGIKMADCSNISRQLGDILDVSLDIETEYRLEISSPGIYRPLFNRKDYVKFSGRNVEIRTAEAVDGKKKFSGVLKGISENDNVTLSVDGNEVEIHYSSIKKARLTENNGDGRC
jgi:ribosome maturation factor RimP